MTVNHPAGPGATDTETLAFAELPASPAVLARAMRLEALLGDPRDPANPFGLPALTGGPAGGVLGRIDDLLGVLGAPGALGAPGSLGSLGEGDSAEDSEQLARYLRPVFRRDLALGLACVHHTVRTPTDAAYGPLCGSALTAAAGAVLRATVGVVVHREPYDPHSVQWHPTLAAAFADLLACAALTVVALRCAGRSTAGGGRTVAAATAYLVPDVVGEVLADLELVLTESGCGTSDLERRALAKLLADLAGARSLHAAAEAGRTALVAALPRLAATAADTVDTADTIDHTRPHNPLFRIGGPVSDEGPPCEEALSAALTRLGARTDVDALGRVARRLVSEQRVLRPQCAQLASHLPPNLTVPPGMAPAPAALALADRQALLLMSGAVAGVWADAEAEPGGRRTLADPSWALLALSRATGRLGVPQPALGTDPREAVWTRLVDRWHHGVDFDLYGTRVLS